MKFLLIIALNIFLMLSACSKKDETNADSKTAVQKTDSVSENLQKGIQELNQKLIDEEKEKKKKALAQATIKIKKKEKKKMDTIMTIKLKTGTVKIKLNPDLAPNHVERMRVLADKGFYDGLKFHRVIKGFMAQTGDPQGNGTGGSDLEDLQAEFNSKPFERGVLGMARSASPHSANSQFFIMLADAPHLNNAYTAFGEVISGMEHVDQIKLGDGPNGSVSDPDKMIKVTVTN